MAAIKFDDREYRRSHMKAPRGRGSWAFQAYGDAGLCGEIVFFFGSLSEAKVEARKHFRQLDLAGDVYVAVLP